MRFNLLISFVLMIASTLTLRASVPPASDDLIRDMLIGSTQYVDDIAAAKRAFRHAQQECGDSNRFARILCELSQTNDLWIARDALFTLAAYGTREQLPQLYSLAANTNLCCDALSAVLRIDGVSSNFLAAVNGVVSDARLRKRERLDLCRALLENAYSASASTAQRDMALSFLLTHFRTCPYPQGLDEALVRKDAGYRHSRRRLANLRAVYAHGVDQWNIAYVTNAINELVAYPEQNLPE